MNVPEFWLFCVLARFDDHCCGQAAVQHPTKEQLRKMDGAFLAVGALHDVLRKEVRSHCLS